MAKNTIIKINRRVDLEKYLQKAERERVHKFHKIQSSYKLTKKIQAF